jgi:3-dehydroquinate synthase
MADSAVSDEIVVQSHAGPYAARVDDDGLTRLDADPPAGAHFVVDERVADLYANELPNVLASSSILRVEATEREKSLDRFPGYVEHLVAHGVRRGHVLVAIGGGIIQDITCFLAATLLRGLEWRFYPTTLLAQADSCIGSKSSINVGDIKNVLGTFTPPREVVVVPHVLDTLADVDVRSGIGEMLKVTAIDGPSTFDALAADYGALARDRALMIRWIRRALEIKRGIIEIDEFDKGPRNVMNYGHSFGHAIESATAFGVPHGIAVTIGMDMANYIATRLGQTSEQHFERMHPTLAANYAGFERTEIPLDLLLAGLAKDKKNIGADLRLVLPGGDGRPRLVTQAPGESFRAICADYLADIRTR